MEKKKFNLSSYYWNTTWPWAITLMLIGLFLSAFRLLDFPEGGSVSFLSLFILWLFTFIFGWKKGMCFSVIFGFLRYFVAIYTKEFLFVDVPDSNKLLVFILEFPIAYGIFFVGGFLEKKDNKKEKNEDEIFQIKDESSQLITGYLIGVILQYLVYVTTAITLYDSTGRGILENILYCLYYDAFGLGCEAGLTLIFLAIPQVREAIFFLKFVATHKDTNRYITWD